MLIKTELNLRSKRRISIAKWSAETTSSGPDSQHTNSEKKCCLQLTVESGKNDLNEWSRGVMQLQL